MKSLAAGIYNLVYRVSGNKPLAFGFAVIYVSLLNLVLLYGFSLLMKDLFPVVGLLTPLFRFPINIFALALMAGLTFWLMPSRETIAKESKRVKKYTPLIVYTAIALLIFAYSKYSDKLF
jgi:hypothetical protein